MLGFMNKVKFNKAVHGPVVIKKYATMPTAELARELGVTARQIFDFIYRNNTEPWAGKDAAVRSRGNSLNGKKGGRPRKKS